jgi:hypothetical protein
MLSLVMEIAFGVQSIIMLRAYSPSKLVRQMRNFRFYLMSDGLFKDE